MPLHTAAAYDKVLVEVADYLLNYEVRSAEALRMARYTLMDTVGCAVAALSVPDCIKLLGPVVPEASCRNGARVPGTQLELDPVTAAFNFGTAARWLELNDSFSAVEGAHPSDNYGALLSVADYLSRRNVAEGKPPLAMRDVLVAAIKAYEIQGVLQLLNSFAGYDYIMLTRIAATAVVTRMLGGGREQILSALSNAWADGPHLKLYRQDENTGERKSWAAGDAAARAVRLALIAMRGEMGYPTVLTAKRHGFYDVLYKGQPFKFDQGYGSYVMENVIFKYVPAGNHGQTAVECATKLHPLVKDRIADIESITIDTQYKLLGIMDKKGPLLNPAARDHCAQYIVAVGMIYGGLEVDNFSDEFAADPRIDSLRDKMIVREEPRYSKDFLDPAKRSKANAIQVFFRDGTSTPKVEVEYTIGHPRRRDEGVQMVEAKFRRHIARRFPEARQSAILEMFRDQAALEAMPAPEFMARLVI
jgi:2-methylcitrate dehydratase